MMKSEHFTETEVEQFIHGYVTAGTWADLVKHENDEDFGSEPYKYDETDLTEESAKKVREECIGFMDSNHDDIRAYCEARDDCYPVGSEDTVLGFCGHDFYLTAAGHGAGFWDRGLGELGDRLTKESKPYTINMVWLDGDGKINFEI